MATDFELKLHLAVRDFNKTSHEWREGDEASYFAKGKKILLLPGSGVNSVDSANRMCEIFEKMLPDDVRKKTKIFSLYFPQRPKHREGSAGLALLLEDEFILPLISKRNKNRDLEKINPEQAKQNLRDVVMATHCYGSYMIEAIDEKLASDLRNLGYSPTDCADIQKQLFVLHMNDISVNLGQKKMGSTNLYRITQADEKYSVSNYAENSFQYYVLNVPMFEGDVAYIKVGENERALFVSQVSEDGVHEHNGAYWHNENKSMGGEKEQQLFELIFNEIMSSNYSLDYIEKVIRQAVRKNEELKPIVKNALLAGRKLGNEYKHRRAKIKSDYLEVKDLFSGSGILEKDTKKIDGAVLLYLDENNKMLIDYAIENNDLAQTKVLWDACRRLLPKGNDVAEARFGALSSNYKIAYHRNKQYLQKMLDMGRCDMFAVLAKGSDFLPRLNYETASDETLLSAGKIYAGLPSNTDQQDMAYYYKNMVYIYSRVEKMPKNEQVDDLMQRLETKMFTKTNLKDLALQDRIKSYARQFGADELLKKCENMWKVVDKSAHNPRDLNQHPQGKRGH